MNENIKCYKCSWLAFRESGYSEWTVTNSWIECMCGRFNCEGSGYDRGDTYTDAQKEDLGLIEKACLDCPYYREGEPVNEYIEDSDEYELRELARIEYCRGR